MERPSSSASGAAEHPNESPIHLAISQPFEVEVARRQTRALATRGGFSIDQSDELVVVVSELATNLMRYAVGGSLTLTLIRCAGRAGMRIESRDAGPGIDDVERALQDGFSTGHSLGSGLPIVRRLTDDSTIESSPAGTSIVAHKWTRSN